MLLILAKVISPILKYDLYYNGLMPILNGDRRGPPVGSDLGYAPNRIRLTGIDRGNVGRLRVNKEEGHVKWKLCVRCSGL